MKENKKGELISLPKQIDIDVLLEKLEDTTSTMFQPSRYKEFSLKELIDIQENAAPQK